MPQYQELTADDIWSMLSAIDAHDRDDWRKVGMAIKSHLGDAGWTLFDDWSKTADNYNASAVRSTWRSCRGSGYKIGTLVYLAKQNGWRKDAPTMPAPAPRREPAYHAEGASGSEHGSGLPEAAEGLAPVDGCGGGHSESASWRARSTSRALASSPGPGGAPGSRNRCTRNGPRRK